jgi:hypothetical protein
MPTYEVTAPNGQKFDITAPDGATQEQVLAYAQQQFASMKPQESAGMRAGRDLPGALRGLSSVAHGPTFGFSDELAGLVGGGVGAMRGRGFKDEYTRVRDMARGAAKQETEDNPLFSTVTRLAASAPTLLMNPFARAIAPTTTLGRTGLAAAQGATFGSLSGAGESTAETTRGVLGDTAKGGALSAATGAALTPLTAMIGGAARRGASYVRPKTAESYAQQKVAEALLRDSQNAATRAPARLGALGPEARVVDAGGENTRQLLDTLATLPGKTKQATEEAIRLRQAGRGDRMIGAAQEKLNPAGIRLSETVDDLVTQRATAAAPLYEALYKRTIAPTDSLRTIVEAADKLGAGAAARRMATASRVPYTLGKDAPQMQMRDLDQLKQGLDDIIGGLQRAGNKKEAASVLGLKHDLTKELDGLTGGAYKAARDAFSGPSALIDAAEAGRKALTLDDMGISSALKGLSQSEQEAFRVGAAEALRAKLGTRAGQTQVMELWREKGMQEKLKAIFGSERAYREFAADVAKERRMKGLESVGRGSQTAARQYGAGDLDVSAIANAAQTVGSIAHGGGPGMLAGMAQAWNKVKTPEPVRDRMGGLLLSQGAKGRADLADLQRVLEEVNRARTQRAGLLGMIGPAVMSAQ